MVGQEDAIHDDLRLYRASTSLTVDGFAVESLRFRVVAEPLVRHRQVVQGTAEGTLHFGIAAAGRGQPRSSRTRSSTGRAAE